jgi:hypothetical protein
VARARDGDCVLVAAGCTDADVPADAVEVTLAPVAMPSADCCGSACVDGICSAGDAGPTCVDDGNPCTFPRCNPLGECEPISAADGTPCAAADSPCTAMVCVAGMCSVVSANEGATCATSSFRCVKHVCRNGTCAMEPDNVGAPCPMGHRDSNPCTVDVCADTLGCRVAGNDENGTRCGGDYQHRCCGGTCVNVFQDTDNCGACGLRCRGPRPDCQERGDNTATCVCRDQSECPVDPGSGNWMCNGTSPPPGRCDCEFDGMCRVGGSAARCVSGASVGHYCHYDD